MSVSWRQKCVVLSIIGVILMTQSKIGKPYNWEEMLPKKIPPPSSPSGATNSFSASPYNPYKSVEMMMDHNQSKT